MIFYHKFYKYYEGVVSDDQGAGLPGAFDTFMDRPGSMRKRSGHDTFKEAIGRRRVKPHEKSAAPLPQE